MGAWAGKLQRPCSDMDYARSLDKLLDDPPDQNVLRSREDQKDERSQEFSADDLARAMLNVAVQKPDHRSPVFENREIRAMVRIASHQTNVRSVHHTCLEFPYRSRILLLSSLRIDCSCLTTNVPCGEGDSSGRIDST